MLEEQGAEVIVSEYVGERAAARRAKRWSPHLYWTNNLRILGAVEEYRDKVDGMVFLIAFPCGPDSLATELAIRTVKEVPVVSVILDEHTGEGGLRTRMESFVDIIRMNRKQRQRPGASTEPPGGIAAMAILGGKRRFEKPVVSFPHMGHYAWLLPPLAEIIGAEVLVAPRSRGVRWRSASTAPSSCACRSSTTSATSSRRSKPARTSSSRRAAAAGSATTARSRTRSSKDLGYDFDFIQLTTTLEAKDIGSSSTATA